MQLILKPCILKVRHTFTISRESHDEQPFLVVAFNEDGFFSFGKATSNPYYKIGFPEMMKNLEQLEPLIADSSDMAPEEFWEKMYSQLPKNMFALCALNLVYNDL